MSQLSLYMAKVGTAKEIFEPCLVGYLIDKTRIQFVISPLIYNNTPLPVAMVPKREITSRSMSGIIVNAEYG